MTTWPDVVMAHPYLAAFTLIAMTAFLAVGLGNIGSGGGKPRA